MAVNDFKSDYFKAWVSKISIQVDLYTILKAAWYGALQLAHGYPKQFYTSCCKTVCKLNKLAATLLSQTTVNDQGS